MKITVSTTVILLLLQGAAHSQSWNLSGNAGTNPTTQFIGTTDAKALRFRTNNSVRLSITNSGKLGFGTGSATPSGWFHIKGKNNESQLIVDAAAGQTNANPLILLRGNDGTNFLSIHSDHPTNSFFGSGAGQSNNASTLTSEGKFNTFIGRGAGFSNSFGAYNIALGDQALFANDNGTGNTALGAGTLTSNVTGNENVAIGFAALGSNLNSGTVAIGAYALSANTTKLGNIAIGYNALRNNGTGQSASFHSQLNTAIGYEAQYTNTLGDENTSVGYRSLYSNTTGFFNLGMGPYSLYHNQAGTDNVALGRYAGFGATGINFSLCNFLGSTSYLTTSRTNVTLIGSAIVNAQATGNNQLLLGNTSLQQIRAQVTGITAYSDARYKTNVKEDVKGLDFITRLKPVSYNVRPLELHKIWGTPDSLVNRINHSETEQVRYTGLIAQDVEKAMNESGYAFTGIDIPTNDKETYAIRYTELMMPLIKAVQEQQKMIEDLKIENNTLQQRLSTLEHQSGQKSLSPAQNHGKFTIVQIYPNPASDMAVVELQGERAFSQAEITITDMKGKILLSTQVINMKSHKIEIPIAGLAAGIYTLSLKVDGIVEDTKQLVKE
jgi:hypothetical protein